MQESSQWEIASLFYVSGWTDFMIVASHCTGHELELLGEKLEKTSSESLEVCKAFPDSSSSPLLSIFFLSFLYKNYKCVCVCVCMCMCVYVHVCVCMCDTELYHSIMTICADVVACMSHVLSALIIVPTFYLYQRTLLSQNLSPYVATYYRPQRTQQLSLIITGWP